MFSSVSHIDKLLFTRELSVLLKSGVALGDALESLQSKTRAGAFRAVIDTLLADVENGQLLSHSLSRFPKVFDPLYLNMVRIGETSGTLKENLAFLSGQLDASYTLRKKIQGILLYPAIVLSMALILGAAISVFILPKLMKLFDSFDVALPLSTRILIALSSLMERQGIVIFAAIFAAIILFRIFITRQAVKPYWHRLLLALPVFGEFFQNVAIAHFCRDMGTMLESGLPLLESLSVEEKVMENRAIARLVGSLSVAVSQGRSIADELSRKQYALIPPLAAKMIAAGEKTGRLGETLIYLESFFESEVDRKIKNMTVIFEPLLLIVIGLIVAFLALAILTPIYSLTGSIKPS
jgi:type II secretory pathway component PulF